MQDKEYSRILRIRNIDLKFRSLRHSGEFGHIIDNEITIDLKRQSPAAKTFIHECLHYLHPNMPHAEIYSEESRIWEKLTNKQVARLYRKMFDIYSC